jgi:hypothetical protein
MRLAFERCIRRIWVSIPLTDKVYGRLAKKKAAITVTETIPVNLRVDVFGDLNGRIVNNASNSGALATIALVWASAPAAATIITGPANLATFTSGATYGPPSPAHFTEPGPITVSSGTQSRRCCLGTPPRRS